MASSWQVLIKIVVTVELDLNSHCMDVAFVFFAPFFGLAVCNDPLSCPVLSHL